MPKFGTGLVLCAAACATALSIAAEQDNAEAPPPRDVGLEERTGRHLVQLDVTVGGPAGIIAALDRDDFELRVGGETIGEIYVDRLCPGAVDAKPAAARAGGEPAPTVPARPAQASFLFYFDQPFLTPVGRRRAIELSRELIPELLREGGRAAIVSSGNTLTTFAELTDDADALLRALERLENDPGQWSEAAGNEVARIDEVVEAMEEMSAAAPNSRFFTEDLTKRVGDEAPEHMPRVQTSNQNTDSLDATNAFNERWGPAIGKAREHGAEERRRSARALELFAIALGRLAGEGPPRAAVYFADRVRTQPGTHYMTLFPDGVSEILIRDAEMHSLAGMNRFDRVIDVANAHGVRLYTVQAEGLVANTVRQSRFSPRRSSFLDESRSALVGLARETGGQAFLNDVGADRIAGSIRDDLSCLYLISFDAGRLPEDRALAVRLRVLRPGVVAHTRGRTYVASASARLNDRLTSAFSAPGSEDAGGLRGFLVPTGFQKGKYTALLQVAAAGLPGGGATWDLGASLVAGQRVREEASGRIAVDRPGVPVVLESELRFAPGPFELVAVAHETGTGQVVTARLEQSWPDPDEAPASLTPLAVMQPAAAAFVREGRVRQSGPLGRSGSLLRTDLPTALIGLVCRGKSERGRFSLVRRLNGESEVRLDPLELDLGEERCTQFRDLIPADTLTPGSFTYAVEAVGGGRTLAATELVFVAVGPN